MESVKKSPNGGILSKAVKSLAAAFTVVALARPSLSEAQNIQSCNNAATGTPQDPIACLDVGITPPDSNSFINTLLLTTDAGALNPNSPLGVYKNGVKFLTTPVGTHISPGTSKDTVKLTFPGSLPAQSGDNIQIFINSNDLRGNCATFSMETAGITNQDPNNGGTRSFETSIEDETGPSSTTICITSTMEVQTDDEISAYPNPNSGRFQIKGILPSDQITITDATGKIVQEATGIVEFSNFERGMYFVRIERNGKMITKKVAVQ